MWWVSHWARRRRDARSRREQAEQAAAASERLLHETREVVRPLARIHERNQFSDMIRDALQVGYGKGVR